MPSHAPRYLVPVKQLGALAKREARLQHAMGKGGEPSTVARLAEEVRRSQLSVLKARRELLAYDPETVERVRKLSSIVEDENLWRELDVLKIVERYETSNT